MDIQNSLSRFQFIGSCIKSCNFNNTFVTYTETKPLDKSFDLDYSDPEINESSDALIGVIDLTVTVHCSDDSHALDLSLVIEGAFTFPKESSVEQFRTMLTLNGCTTLYTICRSFIMSLTAQSFAVGQIILPMINMLNYQREHQSIKQQTE